MSPRPRVSLLFAFIIAGSWASGAALAQTPYLVKDINLVQDSSAGSNPGGFTLVNGTTYFVAQEANTGLELWKTDGTTAGTVIVKDINPGDGSSYPGSLTAVGGTLFFTNYDPVHGSELWKSDGTVVGTTIVRDLVPGFDSSGPTNLTDVNGTLFFTAYDPAAGQELFKSDGTQAGTVLVKDINPGPDGSSPASFIAMNGALFFSAYDPAVGQELWRSDGTAAGTVLVSDINTGPDSSYPASPALFNGALFFSAADPVHGTELWKSDGSAAGTILVQDLSPGPNGTYPFRMTASGGMLYFVTDDPDFTSAIWKTDGSVGGATLVRGGYSYGNPGSLTGVGGTLFFTASNLVTYANELWMSDGTTAGTHLVPTSAVNFAPVPDSLRNLNGTLALAAYDSPHGMELWKSDGTDVGTTLIDDIKPGFFDSNIQFLTYMGGALLFNADDGTHGSELWKSDGTTAGTALLKEIEPGDSSSHPGSFADRDGTAFFFAYDPAPGLWRSDGSAAGTLLVGDGPDFPSLSTLVPLNGLLIGQGIDADHGGELWRTDGTLAGTGLLKDIDPGVDWGQPDQFTLSNGTLFFRAYDPDHGTELWKTDGTEAGTVLIKETVPGPDSSFPGFLTDVDGTLFFTDGYATIWKSDGTDAGTVPIVVPGGYFAVGTVTDVNGTAFFFTFDFGSYEFALWKTDGTPGGTVPVKAGFSQLPLYRAVAGVFFFTEMDNQTGAVQLWRSDGSDAGTFALGAAAPWSGPQGLTVSGGRLFFTATDADHGLELYTSDGTEAGTVLVNDINPGPDGSNPVNLADVGGVLFFGASEPAHGRELWRSDGTDAGTALVADIAPGPGGSDPQGMMKSGSHIYFSASGSVFGEPRNRELWAMSLCTPSPEICDGIDNDCNGLVDENFPDGCACVVMPAGLVGWWPADGSTADIQGGNNGNPGGPIVYTAGRVGQAFSLGPGDPFVDGIGAASTYSFVQDTGVFTMMAWIRLADPSEPMQHGIMGNAFSTGQKGSFFIWENSDGQARLRLALFDGTPFTPLIDSYSAPNAVATSGWHHVAAVGDGTHVTFYVDGVASPGSGAIGSLSAGDSSGLLVIGGCGQACGFHGEIDEAQIYDRALGAAEVRAIFLASGHGLCRCSDQDGDGYGVEGNPACPAGLLPDCDDTSATVHPGAPDNSCDGVDNDCDGLGDEDSPWACQCVIPAGGPVGWWPGDGDAHDLRAGRDGTIEGNVTFVPGVVGQAFGLDGVGAFIDGIGDPSSFSFMQDTGVFTIDAWINLVDPEAAIDQTITANGLGGVNTGHVFRWQNSGGEQALLIQVMSGTPGSPTYFSSSPAHVITTTGWHHIAVVADGQHIRFHVDGVTFAGSGVVGTLGSGDSSYPLHIGGLPAFYPAEKFAGLIDEVRIWNRALGASEIRALASAGASGPCRCLDSDADGFGAGGGLSCSRGAFADCDDSNATVWGAPFEVAGLGLATQVSTSLTWDDQATLVGPGVEYDILRGILDRPVGSTGEVCLGPVAGAHSTQDTTMPALGTGFFYLVRARNTCGTGTYGTTSNGAARISNACP